MGLLTKASRDKNNCEYQFIKCKNEIDQVASFPKQDLLHNLYVTMKMNLRGQLERSFGCVL